MANEGILAATKPIDHDAPIDECIRACLKIGSGKSFITFAGAGSGKTYSLKLALDHLKTTYQDEFSRIGKQVAVVTFTNNAATEIQDRIERNAIFSISTIHSFCWRAIEGFNEDIRKWYLSTMPNELADLEDKQRRGRVGKASNARKRNIDRLTEKVTWLGQPRRFIYDPNGVNSDQNALSHVDVLKIFSHFLMTKPMMAEVLANKYPFVFVDESQDTDKAVINALFELQKTQVSKTIIGLFGDTMQRIFGGGEPQLGKSLPENWIVFDKKLNHRSAKRIVGLGNTIRNEDDGRCQYAKDGAENGYVRFFLLPNETPEKHKVEQKIRKHMANLVDDPAWNDPNAENTAILLLEHKMVSRRLDFAPIADALSKSSRLRESIFKGECAELNYFSHIIFPLMNAGKNQDAFEIMSLLRSNKSPLLEETVFSENENDPLYAARIAEQEFQSKASKSDVTFLQVLEVIAKHRLLPIPKKLKSFLKTQNEDAEEIKNAIAEILKTTDNLETPNTATDDEIEAWANALQTPFKQIQGYRDYINEKSIYRTHQGVKGNEFERVMVIMDDNDAGGFMFSYEQYFSAKDPSKKTPAKIDAGKETGVDRTRRLFYVTSTRAKKSLVHVIYTADVEKVRNNLIERKFATHDEIVISPF
tara:strand:- start:660 stop:2597 length:1938 start_codon:yes stop_codon:yes gene_type:complete